MGLGLGIRVCFRVRVDVRVRVSRVRVWYRVRVRVRVPGMVGRQDHDVIIDILRCAYVKSLNVAGKSLNLMLSFISLGEHIRSG